MNMLLHCKLRWSKVVLHTRSCRNSVSLHRFHFARDIYNASGMRKIVFSHALVRDRIPMLNVRILKMHIFISRMYQILPARVRNSAATAESRGSGGEK